MFSPAASHAMHAIKALGEHAELLFGRDHGYIILTVPYAGGTGHIATNLDNESALRALRNATGAIEPAVVSK